MPQEEQHHPHHAAAAGAVVPGHSSLSPSPSVMGCGLAVGVTKRRNHERGANLPHVVASSSQSKIDGAAGVGATDAAPGRARLGQSQRHTSASGLIMHAGGGGSTRKGDKASSSFAERPAAAGIVIGGGKKQRPSATQPPQLPNPPPAANKDRRERERELDAAEYYWLGVQAAMVMDDATLDAEVEEFFRSKGVEEDQRSRHRRQEAVEKKPFSFVRLADEEAEADLMKISRWAKEADRRRAAEEEADASHKRCRRRH